MVSVALFILFIGWTLCILIGWLFDDDSSSTVAKGVLEWIGTIVGILFFGLLCAAFVIILFH